jgi:hypothetical protein
MDISIDYAHFTGVSRTDEVAQRQSEVDYLRSQAEIERDPSYYQRQKELEGRSEWTGATWGGRARF